MSCSAKHHLQAKPVTDGPPRPRPPVLRYPPPLDGSTPRKATRQRLNLGLALHQEVPHSEMQAPSPTEDIDRPATSIEVGTVRAGRQVHQSLRAGELHGHRSASTSGVETASQRFKEDSAASASTRARGTTDLVMRCRCAPSLMSSASLVVTHQPIPQASSSYDSGHSSHTPPSGLRAASMRGRLRSAKPDGPAPVTEEGGDGESGSSLAAKVRQDKPVIRREQPTRHLSWVSGDEPTPSSSPSTRRSSRRPSTAPSLDRDPLWLPPAFGTSSPRAAVV